MRYLGLDLGTKSLGIAISDRTNSVATPLITLHFKEEDYESVLTELQNIIKEKDITDLVLGLPKNMDNSLGFAAERSKKFQSLLEDKIKIPVHLIDERLSSKEAENILISTDIKRVKRKKVVDNVAAAIILDTFLEERRIKNEREQK